MDTQDRLADRSVLDGIGHTPLVSLARLGRGKGARVFAKCEHQNPGGSIKDRIAREIVDQAEASGRLQPGGTLIEATAGNTGVGLGLVCAVRGYKLCCVMPEKMSIDKRTQLSRMGAELIITENAPPGDPRNFQEVARRMAEQRGWLLTDQFKNPANITAHEQGTGREIIEQLAELAPGERVWAFVAGCGTGGTLTGVGRALRKVHFGAQVVLADPEGSRLAGVVKTGELGPDGSYAVEGIGGSVVPANLDVSLLSDAISVTDRQSFDMVKRLVHEEGLLVGGSAGTNVAAALAVAERAPPNAVIVTVLPDSWDRYRDTLWMKELFS